MSLKNPKVLLQCLVKWDLLEAEVELKKATRETLVVGKVGKVR